MSRQKNSNLKLRRTANYGIESLESRTLLAGTVVSVVSTFSLASESNRTTTGRGEYVFKRPTGDTTLPLTIKYAINGDSTATNSVDFETLTGKIVIPSGKRSVAMNLIPINDSDDEPAETVIVSIKNQTGYTVDHRNAVVTIKDNDPTPTGPSIQGWWDTNYHYRAPISVDVGSFGRTDSKPVEQSINFTSLLNASGGSGSLIENSIRVIETNADGTQVVDADVPFQFDKASNYNGASNASGNLIFTLKGNTSSNVTRHYHVYFDTAGSFNAYTFNAQISTDTNTSDEGMDAIKVDTQTATYWLQKANGGFSSITDKNGNDWLGFNPTSGSASGGEYRGTPNAVFPGGGFHAGFNVGSTAVISTGPLKTTLETTLTADKQDGHAPYTYKMRYEFYARYVVATMIQADSSYWFLYEGTPGGSVDNNDTVVRSNGTTTDISTSWTENNGISGNGEEWVYFRDSAVGKHMYFVHNSPDNIKDSYYRQDVNGSMTVFGFGRDNDVNDATRQKLTAINNSFTFGIEDDGADFNANADSIRGIYRPISLNTGASQHLT